MYPFPTTSTQKADFMKKGSLQGSRAFSPIWSVEESRKCWISTNATLYELSRWSLQERGSLPMRREISIAVFSLIQKWRKESFSRVKILSLGLVLLLYLSRLRVSLKMCIYFTKVFCLETNPVNFSWHSLEFYLLPICHIKEKKKEISKGRDS